MKKHLRTLAAFRLCWVTSWMLCTLGIAQVQTVETPLPDRDAVIAEINRIFSLSANDAGVAAVTIVNPSSQSVLVLGSFGGSVEFMATIMEKIDSEVIANTNEWATRTTEPLYVQGPSVVILNTTKETALKQVFETRNMEYVVEYLVNHNTAGEVAAYEKVLRTNFEKSGQAASVQAIMGILDVIFEYDWLQVSVKRVASVQPE